MARRDFRGFTIKIAGHYLEYVSYKHLPATLALSNKYNQNTLWRIDLQAHKLADWWKVETTRLKIR